MIMTEYLRSIAEDALHWKDVAVPIKHLWKISYAFGQNDCLAPLQRVESELSVKADECWKTMADDITNVSVNLDKQRLARRSGDCMFYMHLALAALATCRELRMMLVEYPETILESWVKVCLKSGYPWKDEVVSPVGDP